MGRWITCLVLTLFTGCDCSKIGIFTAPLSRSHIQFSLSIADILAEAGHEVVVIRPTFNPECDSVQPKHAAVRQIQGPQVPPAAMQLYFDNLKAALGGQSRRQNIREFGEAMRVILTEGCRVMANDSSFIERIQAEKIELAFNHHMDLCQMVIAHHVGVRRWVSSNPGPPHNRYLWDMRQLHSPSYYPEFLSDTNNEMTFFDQQINIGIATLIYYTTPWMDDPQTEILRQYLGQETISVDALRQTAVLSFININRLIEYPFSSAEELRFIGGFAMTEPKKLQEPFLSFVEKDRTTVVISFGSAVRAADMSLEWKQAFYHLIESNPEYNFILKFEDDFSCAFANITGSWNPSNLLVSKWIPQADLLRTVDNAILITHGGYNSVLEAARAGVPCLIVPISADQFRNGRLVEKRGFGMQLTPDDFSTPALLSDKLRSVANNPKFRERSQIMSSYMKMYNPREELIKWTDFAMTSDIDPLPNRSYFDWVLTGFLMRTCLCFALMTVISLFAIKFLWKIPRKYLKDLEIFELVSIGVIVSILRYFSDLLVQSTSDN